MIEREPVWRRYLRFIRPDTARDVDDELAFHLAMREEEFLRMGLNPEEARRVARERFGQVRPVRDATLAIARRLLRSRLRSRHLLELGQDLHFGLRTLRKRPGFTAAVILTLAIGIGFTTAIFAVMHAVLFQPPAQVRNSEELVAVFTSDFSGPLHGSSSHPDYEDFRGATDVLAGLASYETRQPNVVLRGAAQLRPAEIVSGNYFEVLGVTMQRGRAITAGEDAEPAPVAVISDALWRHSADADPNIVGQPIKVNGHVFTIVGVAPPKFAGAVRGTSADLWIPRSMSDVLEGGRPDLPRRDSRGLLLVGRLAPGVTREAAQARFDGIAAQLFTAYPEMWRDLTGAGRHVSVVSEKDARITGNQRGRVLAFFGLLMGAVTVLLLLCSANVATLLLVRGTARAREIAVRLSIGASRGRVVRQLMTENLVLALAGGVAGLWIAMQAATALLAMLGAQPGDLEVGLHGPVIAFALAVTLSAGLFFGVAPALRASRADLNRELKGDPAGASLGRRRFALRDLLVTAQVALSLVLLAVAGLLVRSLQNTLRTDTGFDPRRLVMVSPALGLQGYDSSRARAYYRDVQAGVSALPGVRDVVLGRAVPLGGGVSRQGISIEGYERRPGEELEFGINRVEPGYFRLMGIPLVQGRDFALADGEGAPDVAIVNETFAQRFWPGQSPLGRRLSVASAERRTFTIVGVARDIDYGRVGEESRPFFYLRYAQYPSLHMVMHVRTAGDERAVLEVLKTLLKEVDPEVPVDLETMEERVARLLAPQRASTTLLTMLGAVGLLLAGTGLYGVIAFTVAQRTREFGIRMALGATSARVRRMVVRQGVALGAAGVVLGMLAALAVTRALAAQLIGVSPGDPLTYAIVVAVLLAVAAAASWVPARRATALNPADVIRQE